MIENKCMSANEKFPYRLATFQVPNIFAVDKLGICFCSPGQQGKPFALHNDSLQLSFVIV